MNFLVTDYNNISSTELQAALCSLGHDVFAYSEEPENPVQAPRFCSQVRHLIKEQQIDAIFSLSYFPIFSKICFEMNIPYICWCHDTSLVASYSDSIYNDCNYFFLFDSQMLFDLRNAGISHAYYLPLAATFSEKNAVQTNNPEMKNFIADISLIDPFYPLCQPTSNLLHKLDEFTQGYLDGLMQIQHITYGCSLLENYLTDDIIQELYKVIPPPKYIKTPEAISHFYCNNIFYPQITGIDYTEILNALEQKKGIVTRLYTNNCDYNFSNITNMGVLPASKDDLIFQQSKINLNITPRNIKSGIPANAMNIMGAGGFLLTNYQNDFKEHFIEGKDYVCYSDSDDLLEKIQYFLEHEEERKTIAKNGYLKVNAEHTYQKRVEELLKILHFAD